MENKKMTIAIIILIILIIAIVGFNFAFSEFNNKQTNILTEETNKILQSDITKENIDFNIKTERNYAVVEKAIKEYISELKNIYKEISEIDENINPNNIFSAQNMQDKELKAIDEIITDYNDKIQETTDELEDLLKEDKIKENITKREISQRKEYYINLYNTIMFSDVMKTQYRNLESEIKTEKSKLTDKVKQIEKTNEFLKKNSDSWTIKNDKIQFTNLIRMTEYYNLLNKLAE
ncbi:unknown [Clostridium sp. CAG:356]|nr:unknown [Clostridium sp. CAG:356]